MGVVSASSPLMQLPNTYRAFYGAFTSLRPFQRQVIAPILQRQDVILQAATGSGKTEAVLAPCLERVLGSGEAEAILYVVPTRALVHDLRRRLELLVHERLGLRLGVRTGDVKYLPAGQADVLLTTPESLDVMLGSPNREVQAFLRRVTMFIVDEVHQLMQGYRGRHLAYLLQRLERRSKRPLQKIALSATLAGPEALRTALGLRADTVWVGSAVQRQIQPHLVHLQREQEELVAFIDDLAVRFGYRKLLLFANSRSRCDRLFALLSHRGHFRQATYLHYSNLKLRQRQEVERQFQRRAQALCIATSTLELGIDVGDVDGVLLYEPPESVTTFLQRLGRANRQAQATTFWGICRGPRAGAQLLQFLALHSLALQGEVEAVQLANLPSVLVQQVLSCLYELKRLSLASLQTLFPQQAETLTTLLPALMARRWLHRLHDNGHDDALRGGWRYAQALRARQVWSNFPDTDVPYTLEVEEKAVADLPTAVVRQLEVGDRVDLAGRCIGIVDIQDGARKVVRAVPVEAPDGKELFWLGSGPPVSWEVAQAVRPLLQPAYEPAAALVQGLFSRPRSLLQQQRQRAERRVVLHNGIELSRTAQGFYRYATYLGSVGNLIVQRSIEAYYGASLEDFSCAGDAIAVECSDRIDLQQLPLPVGREAFRRWAAQHLQALQAVFAFNAFCRALPKALLLEEATDFLWDERLSQTFAHYRQHTSEIASGDPRHLEWDDTPDGEAGRQSPTSLVRQGPQPAILTQEKTRLGLAAAPLPPTVPAEHRRPRALTATMVGNYMQHQQCDRLLSFDLLPFDQQPPKRTLVDSAVGAARAGQGQAFEEQVLAELERQGAVLYRIAAEDSGGRRLTLHARQEQSFARLAEMVRAGASPCRRKSVSGLRAASPITSAEATDEPIAVRSTRHDAKAEKKGASRPVGYLVQAVLMLPTCLGADNTVVEQVDGVGIPDLIEVTVADATVWLTVADIKDSATPRYSQKWQVAFYAALLQECLQRYTFALQIRVTGNGVLFTRAQTPGGLPTRHAFDLTPYLAVLPLLQRHIAGLLTTPVPEAAWQLRAHCTSCAYLDTCYRQALSTDDIMLLPHLTPGEHLKLRTLGLHALSQAAEWLQDDADTGETPLSAQQTTSLQVRVQALMDNRLDRHTEITSLYPANVSTALFVHVLRDPRSGRPRVWGLHRVAGRTTSDLPRCWTAATPADIPTCQEAFVAQLRAWWQEAIATGHGPHLVTFGAGSLWLLREAMGDTAAPAALDFLWSPEYPRHTDLRQLLAHHFALPVPLHLNLASAARVWALDRDIPVPPYLLQDEGEEVGEILLHTRLAGEQVAQLQRYVQTHLILQQQLWQACTPFLRSDWQQHCWDDPVLDVDQAQERACVAFLERQQRWRERDILALQQLPLSARLERYRALGPLVFEESALDAEGRFVYHFRLPPSCPPARFRAGDFLRLNPVGSPDLQEGSGVILTQYEPHAHRLAIVARRGHLALNRRLQYTLDEDLEDWTTPRVLHAVQEAFTPGKHPHLMALLAGALPLRQSVPNLAWVQRWLRQVDLNTRQQEALLLPFRTRLGLIEGPPGTGKTYVLAWMLIALILEARQAGRPLRLAVSALTHQAIDNVLRQVQQLLQGPVGKNFPGRCLKWGRRLSLADGEADESALAYVESAEEVRQTPYLILGATGFGLYQLFDSQSGTFPAFFDWIIFDEASQVVWPQALLSLVYGKGQYVFCGDIQQLPPVVRGSQDTEDEARPDRSILAHLLATYDSVGRVRLNETYRLNRELCRLPSRLWYQGDLHPAAANADARLALPTVSRRDVVDEILAPQHPLTLVLAEHTIDHQQSVTEVEIIAELAARLLRDYGVEAERLAILAPHRAQNTAIAQCLASLLAHDHQGEAVSLPLIDTVERLQGAERDVLLFSLTTSDPDHLESPFLNNPNRFNVAITRARHKLVVVGSTAFFTHVPRTEAGLLANYCFKAYYHLCRQAGALFSWPHRPRHTASGALFTRDQEAVLPRHT